LNWDFFQKASGWKAGLVALLSGALAVFAHAPYYAWPAMLLSLTLLVCLIDGAAAQKNKYRAVFFRAWTWGFGYFFVGMFWVGDAFLVDAEKFAALRHIAVSALAGGLALFWGAAGLLAMLLWKRGAGRVITFALAFGLMEMARGHVLTGLPWNLPAYIWEPGGWMSQTGALIGPYGVSFITLALLASPAAFKDAADRRGKWVTAVCVGLVAGGCLGFGAWRLGQSPQQTALGGTGPLVAAGQAGFTQKEVWDQANIPRVTQTYLDMLENPGFANVDLVVWPEGTFPFLLMEEEPVLRAIEARLGTRTLAVGTVRRDVTPQGISYFNSVIGLSNRSGGLAQYSLYDKHHLVPFGEYLPFRSVFQALGIASLVAYDGEMTPGRSPDVLSLPGMPLADARICYEIIFPNFNEKAKSAARYILNVSIDAWYGEWLGPDQHFGQVRWRAIETGLPVVRAASGGWSGIIDPYGRVIASLRRGPGYAMARLPEPVSATPYSRFPLWPTLVIALFGGFFAIFRRFSS
jgi:apolipoprotein N-acyltransferase